VEEGIFADALGDASLETFTFNSGTEASEAILSDSIDATFIGPNPAINAFAQSDGEVKIVAGTTSGGAALVVSQDITSPEDLAGKTLATPSLGNTQDVALRAWLADQGYEVDETGGGDVKITPQENADTLTAFQAGDIQGAWVPEPWATRLVEEGGGHVLVNEKDLWTDTDGQFVTTHLLVPGGAPRQRQGPDQRPARRHRRGERRRGHRRGDHQRRHREDHHQAPGGRHHRRSLGQPHLHRRPGGDVAGEVQGRRRGRRPARRRRHRRNLRPEHPQRPPRRAR
jgi:hypothetical protein